MSIYDELGLPKIINAFGTMTALGGSLMPPEVLQAMADASGQFVDLVEYKLRVGQLIAEMTYNEAAHVCCGAAAGMLLAAAACVAGSDPAAMAQLPNVEGLKNEVVVFRMQRNRYDFAIRQVGVRLREVGILGILQPWELDKAIGPQTAAVFFYAGHYYSRGALSLNETIEIAHRAGVPVIVNAAAQLPPMENLWSFTKAGADLAIFSGGKGLHGPQPTGLIVGRKDLINKCALNDSPNYAIGRPSKVGKEEIAGLLAAIKRYLSLDHKANDERWERQVVYMIEALSGITGVSVQRDFPGQGGLPIPRVFVRIDEERLTYNVTEIINSLRSGNPRIEVGPIQTDSFYVNPEILKEGDESVVVARLRKAFGCD